MPSKKTVPTFVESKFAPPQIGIHEQQFQGVVQQPNPPMNQSYLEGPSVFSPLSGQQQFQMYPTYYQPQYTQQPQSQYNQHPQPQYINQPVVQSQNSLFNPNPGLQYSPNGLNSNQPIYIQQQYPITNPTGKYSIEQTPNHKPQQNGPQNSWNPVNQTPNFSMLRGPSPTSDNLQYAPSEGRVSFQDRLNQNQVPERPSPYHSQRNRSPNSHAPIQVSSERQNPPPNIFRESQYEPGQKISLLNVSEQKWSAATLGPQPESQTRGFYRPVNDTGLPIQTTREYANEKGDDSAFDSLLDKRKNNPRISPPSSSIETLKSSRFPQQVNQKSRSFPYFDLDEEKFDKDSKGEDIQLD